LKYEHGEPQFFKKEPAANGSCCGPDTEKAEAIYNYLKENGINDVEELRRFFTDAGAIFGVEEGEIRTIFAKLHALDAIRNLAKHETMK